MLKENIKRWKKQLTQVKSNREYDSLQKQIGEANERIAELSERRTQLVKQQGEVEDEVKALEKDLKELKEELKSKEEELEEINKEIREEEKNLLKVREKFAKEVDKILLNQYERIRQAVGVLAVVPVNSGTCGGCGARVPSQRIVEIWQNNKIYRCEACGRILISDDVYKEAGESVKL
jgi:predicted  nucleic acid-binding Zn-ribbon protein